MSANLTLTVNPIELLRRTTSNAISRGISTMKATAMFEVSNRRRSLRKFITGTLVAGAMALTLASCGSGGGGGAAGGSGGGGGNGGGTPTTAPSTGGTSF
jgi:uncharacterized membrane protein